MEGGSGVFGVEEGSVPMVGLDGFDGGASSFTRGGEYFLLERLLEPLFEVDGVVLVVGFGSWELPAREEAGSSGSICAADGCEDGSLNPMPGR